MTRRLRIAVSVFFAVLVVLLCVLWVRSYWFIDMLSAPLPNSLYGHVQSYTGVLVATYEADDEPKEWLLLTFPYSAMGLPKAKVQWAWVYEAGPVVAFPHWAPTLLFAVLAAVPWLCVPRRFSLRTMLIVVTLVAAVLGLAVWSAS
jgi:hypothetical protein